MTFWVKGEDGETYGPATLEELVEWIKENRFGEETEIRGNEIENWQCAKTVPQIAALFKTSTSFRTKEIFPAAYSSRIAAFILDSIFLTFLFIFVVAVSSYFLPLEEQIDFFKLATTLQNNTVLSTPEVGAVLMLIFIRISYFTYFHGASGQTPGKKLFKIKVISRSGIAITYRQAFIRALASFLSEIPYAAGYLLIFLNPKRRALHDFVAQTVVIKNQ